MEIVRRGWEHFNRTGEPDFSLFDPDVVLDNSGAIFESTVYRGHAGAREWMARQRDMWQHQRLEREELIPVGDDRVIAYLRVVSVGRDTIETVAHAAMLFTLRQGKMVHMKAFQTKDEAPETAGLSE